MVIGVGLDREDHDSIPCNCDWEMLKPFNVTTNPLIRLDSSMSRIYNIEHLPNIEDILQTKKGNARLLKVVYL
jgi:hypothetical protein